MFTMFKKALWYRSYFIADNVELKNIHFFNESGIVISTGQGWFEHRSESEPRRDLNDVVIGLDLKRKLKIDFTLKDAFYVPIKRESYKKEGKFGELYLPYGAFKWEIKKDAKFIDCIEERRFYDLYMNLDVGFEIEKFSHEEILVNNIMFLDAVKPLFECGGEHINEYTLLREQSKIKTEIKNAALKLFTTDELCEIYKERIRINSNIDP